LDLENISSSTKSARNICSWKRKIWSTWD